VQYYADGTGTFKTKSSSVDIHNLICKLWNEKDQRKFKNISYLGSFPKKIPFNQQLQCVYQTLAPLEKGFYIYNSFYKKHQYVFCNFSNFC
jgi:hypothetical protein